MTVTYDRLSGSFEDLDEVIRYNLENNWTDTNVSNGSENITPDFSSATGSSVSHAWFDNTSFGVNQVVVNEIDEYPDPDGRFIGDYGQFMISLISIDIQGEDASIAKKIKREIDRIIWEIMPRADTTVPKSDTAASHIHSFTENSINWDMPKDSTATEKDAVLIAGTLEIRWFKSKS